MTLKRTLYYQEMVWFQTGTRWLGIGPVRGPRAFEDAPSDGKQYARQDASWAVVGPPPAVTFKT
jgi:hypothetical protein